MSSDKPWIASEIQSAATPTRTGLLISVRDADEARLVLQEQVDILDVKEPANGPLGRAPVDSINAILQCCRKETCVSLALGELQQIHKTRFEAELFFDSIVGLDSIRYAKLGLAGMKSCPQWRDLWRSVIQHLPKSVSAVGVVYADAAVAQSPSPLEIIESAASLGCRVILVDTFNKSAGDVFASLDVHNLAELKRTCTELGMKFVLAGSIRQHSLKNILHIEPDHVGVRGAVCSRRSRENKIDHVALRIFTQELHRINTIRIVN